MVLIQMPDNSTLHVNTVTHFMAHQAVPERKESLLGKAAQSTPSDFCFCTVASMLGEYDASLPCQSRQESQA